MFERKKTAWRKMSILAKAFSKTRHDIHVHGQTQIRPRWVYRAIHARRICEPRYERNKLGKKTDPVGPFDKL